MRELVAAVRRSFSQTSVLVVALVSWFATALTLSRIDVGPDWLDSRRFQHMDAVLMASGVATVAAALTALAGIVRKAARASGGWRAPSARCVPPAGGR